MKYTLFILAAIIVAFASFGKFGNSHFEVPKGCDEFGYLYFAEAIHQQKTFQDHTQRPFASGLIDTLVQEGFTYIDFNWLITPHAYHYTSDLEKTICQYAPGTSTLLSAFPDWLRGTAFAVISTLLLFSALFLVVKGEFWSKLFIALTFTLFAYLLPPFINELNWVNSVAPTVGILIVAGAFAFKQPLLAVFLIALSANFRQVNLLMMLPLSIPLLHEFTKKNIPHALKITAYCGLVAMIGFLPYLVYSYLQFGNPFHLSYSPLDTQFVNPAEVLDNFTFYVNPTNPWFNSTFLVCILSIWMYKKRLFNRQVLFFIWTLFIVNYVFFITHKIHLNYYTYASACIGLGAVLFYLPPVKLKTKYLQLASFGILMLFGIDGFSRLEKNGKEKYQLSKKYYNDLCAYDIVWGHEFSGTSEFTCSNNGFVLHGGTKKARAVIFTYLNNHHYSQAILLNDILLSTKKVTHELDKIGLTYHIVNSKNLGPILEIEKN